MPSIFTKIIQREIPAHIIDETDEFLAFLDIMPLKEGHTLVVPKSEIDYIFDIDDALLGRMMVFSKKIAIALRKAIPCKKVNVSVIGLEVPHAHVHLIPMNTMDDVNFSRPKLKLSAESLAETAKNIRKYL